MKRAPKVSLTILGRFLRILDLIDSCHQLNGIRSSTFSRILSGSFVSLLLPLLPPPPHYTRLNSAPSGFSWILLDSPGFSWILLDSPGFSWIRFDSTEKKGIELKKIEIRHSM